MKRFVDEGAYKYNFYWVLRRGERVDVTCQSCGGHAYIEECQDEITWKCPSCYAHGVEKQVYQYHAKGSCALCERWFNVEVTDEKKVSHKSTHIHCPHCGAVNQAELHSKPVSRRYIMDTRDGRDPVFGMELYFLDHVRGKLVWAVNRAHLNYLISYVSADLRVRRGNVPLKTASHYLPVYMKEAKNREQMVRTLTKLQHKTG